jgi:dTDP-4-dehydrorhamnose 3,5-epimerase
MMIEGVIKTDLTIVPMKSGSISHAYLKTQSDQINIQEIYFSSIQHESIRAWKCHTRMTINLSAVSGSVKIAMIDGREDSRSYLNIDEIILSKSPYFRLTIPPGIWYGFFGLSSPETIICNIADHVHDPQELKRKDYSDFDYTF